MSHVASIHQSAALLLWALVAIATPLTAAASTPIDAPDVYEPTEEQLELNEQGVEALVEQEPARAVALLNEAFRLGEVNILALNLGRAYQALGQCDRARQKLEMVSELPAIENPPPERIEAAAEDYLQDVEESCEPDHQADIEEADSDDLDDDADAEADAGDVDDVDHIELRYDEGLDNQGTIGLISAGSGAAVAAAGLGMHLVARTQRSDVESRIDESSQGINSSITQSEVQSIETRANRLDTAGLLMGIIGLSAGAIGTYMWATAPAPEQSASFDFNVGSDSLELGWTMQF